MAARFQPLLTVLRRCLLPGGLAVLIGACAATGPTPPFATIAGDGPYVFHAAGNQLDALWVCGGKVVRSRLPARDGAVVKPRCGYPHAVAIPARIDAGEMPLPAGARIIAVSDIHGQYALLAQLLRAHRVIDGGDRWNAGRDHLVVAGDVFDRGDDVTEILWLLFQLQQQARAAGGAVHFLLGNHETMALYGSTHYVHPALIDNARLLGRSYDALYAADSVLGQWLRTRPVLLRLGDTLFLHGGIAPQDAGLVDAMTATNAAYQRSLGTPRKQVEADPALAPLYDHKTSPIWYRGYFDGQLDTPAVQALAARLGVARIVVGHTTIGEVASFHGGRVIAIDGGLKRGKTGQLLFIEGDRLSRGLLDGRREALPALQEVPRDQD
nr:metallophosphoesterase [Thermomonas fusca]